MNLYATNIRMATSGSERIVSMDYVKAVSIFLVLLSHTSVPFRLSVWINEFHVPLFFFASGFLFSFRGNPHTVAYIRKRARQLLLPFICIGIVSYVFWLFARRHYGSDAQSAVAWYDPLLSSLYGNTDGMVHNLPLWFFPSLFMVSAVCHVLLRSARRRMLPPVFLLAGYAVYRFAPDMPFLVGQSLVMAAFYSFGYICREKFGNESGAIGGNRRAHLSYWWALLFVPLTLAGVFINDKVAVYHNYYGCYPWFVVFALSGIITSILLCRWLGSTFGQNVLVRSVSDNTLAICGFHLMTYSVLKGIACYGLGIDMAVFAGTLFPNLLLASASICMCLPLAVFIRRHAPWMIGV